MSRALLALVLALLVQGCTLSGGGQPSVQAALTQTLESISSRRALAPPTILITRQVQGGVVVLYTYEADQGPGTARAQVTGVQSIRRVRFGWTSGNGGMALQTAPLTPVEFLTADMDDPGVSASAAYGLVSDLAVRQVAVTFADGSREVTAVENGAYLVVKQPRQEIRLTEALDAAGQVLHRHDG